MKSFKENFEYWKQIEFYLNLIKVFLKPIKVCYERYVCKSYCWFFPPEPVQLTERWMSKESYECGPKVVTCLVSYTRSFHFTFYIITYIFEFFLPFFLFLAVSVASTVNKSSSMLMYYALQQDK